MVPEMYRREFISSRRVSDRQSLLEGKKLTIEMWNRVSCGSDAPRGVFKIDLSREKVAFSIRRSPSFSIPVDYAPLRIAQSVSDDLRPPGKRGRHKKRRVEAAMRIGIGTGSFSRYLFSFSRLLPNIF